MIMIMIMIICDLSRENVPYGIRSNSRTHGMWTDDKRIDKPFKTDAMNGWTAAEKFRTVERLKENFEWLKSNGWTASEKFRTVEVKRMNGWRKFLNGWGRTAEQLQKNNERLKSNGWTVEVFNV